MCGITKHEDKLIAMSGLAETFSRMVDDTYLAGMWRSQIPVDGEGGALKRKVTFHGVGITELLFPEKDPQDPLGLCAVTQDTPNEFDAGQVGFLPIVDRNKAGLEGLLVLCKEDDGRPVYERIGHEIIEPMSFTPLFDSSEAGYQLRKELWCDLVETVIRLV
ncbi:Heterokaryon incompatibility protein [Rutstroemia sp. NJR-2017a WRK4]|nr:Heterokaryon incompatibility protein [Rutstroemia sp. NJR-2017a WRK4]